MKNGESKKAEDVKERLKEYRESRDKKWQEEAKRKATDSGRRDVRSRLKWETLETWTAWVAGVATAIPVITLVGVSVIFRRHHMSVVYPILAAFACVILLVVAIVVSLFSQKIAKGMLLGVGTGIVSFVIAFLFLC